MQHCLLNCVVSQQHEHTLSHLSIVRKPKTTVLDLQEPQHACTALPTVVYAGSLRHPPGSCKLLFLEHNLVLHFVGRHLMHIQLALQCLYCLPVPATGDTVCTLFVYCNHSLYTA